LDGFPPNRTPNSGRFFVLNNDAGLLEYFVNEQSRPQKPRGMLPLAGAVISPSDEDSHTFTVNAISGEQYKLREAMGKVRERASTVPLSYSMEEIELRLVIPLLIPTATPWRLKAAPAHQCRYGGPAKTPPPCSAGRRATRARPSTPARSP
ncbi:hypothetical protein XENOCAPTIV_027418, partial [Xenoophorus captivus]